MITKERLENIKENVYLISEIAKFSGLGIDSSLKEELELIEEIDRLNNIIDEFENWLEKQRIRNSEWDNFVIKDTRLGIPITYLLDKLKELKENK